jgi:hypothetical protein
LPLAFTTPEDKNTADFRLLVYYNKQVGVENFSTKQSSPAGDKNESNQTHRDD